ncbi:pimeloyl-ACP methyl ester esterase BioH [Citrobacter sp. JGM124]|uniref:pimeloyl-ACP methyl ester esterase BioH n=1 Tax=Citrobacter sp. JGM124 TaxID=2799789 RepID=UPI001BAC16DA|nr:pimeloyl-ACP methyl ester esterase BioH [Citrobacter sp. JGM124]
MNTLWWQTEGEGSIDLVLLHGWGLNAEVWRNIIPGLRSHFRIHLVDLPGYGRSKGFTALSLEEMAEIVLFQPQAPERAIWLGWSLGGLVASQIALTHPERVEALVSVASSPCFTARENWPGIKPDVLSGFQHMLNVDFQKTVERFLALQTLGTEHARQDARQLKSVVLAQPIPDVDVLNGGLHILKTADLREPLATLAIPHWRIYGQLDGLVPRKVAELLDASWPQSPSHILPKAAHAPFISHGERVNQILVSLSDSLRA